MSAKRKYPPVETPMPPQIGEIRRAKTPKGVRYVIWSRCIDCGKPRWVRLYGGKPDNPRCYSCMCKERVSSGRYKGSNSNLWRGGRIIRNGYVGIMLPRGSFFYPMATKQGYVREHRLVMAQYLHRCLLPWEVVHHKNGIKDDNRLENLQLLPLAKYHIPSSRWQEEAKKLNERIRQLEARITLIEAENVMLRKELGDKATSGYNVKVEI